MTRYFFDTSGLIKRYHREVGSTDVHKLFAARQALFLVSQLSIVEASSALAVKVRKGDITELQAQYSVARLAHDVKTGLIAVEAMKPSHYAAAGTLLHRYAYNRRLRTLDALQLAVALDLVSQGIFDTLVTADKLMAEVAQLEGLTVFMPVV